MHCTFWLRSVLRATTACNFLSLIWPDGSAPTALASLLFDPPEPQIIGKTQCFATFLPFRAPRSPFFWDLLFFDIFLLLFSSLTLRTSAFPSVHIIGSLTILNFLRIYYIIISYHIISYHIISYHIIICYVMWCDVMWCDVMLYYLILHYIILYYIVSYYIILCYIILYCIILYHIMFYYIILYYIILYYIILNHIILYYVIL